LLSEVLDYDFTSEVFQKQEDNQNPPPQTVLFTFEVDAKILQEHNLPDEFLVLIKKRK